MVDQGEYESVSPEVSTGPVQPPASSSASPPSSTQPHTSMRETCRIAIPNYAVGAIIGAAGANIKRIIRDSNAFVTVRAYLSYVFCTHSVRQRLRLDPRNWRYKNHVIIIIIIIIILTYSVLAYVAYEAYSIWTSAIFVFCGGLALS